MVNLTGGARSLIALIGNLKARADTTQTKRIKEAASKQTEINKRMDRVLQVLVDGASPGLSEHEAKWFKELGRMREEIVGSGKYDERSLAVRAKNVSLIVVKELVSCIYILTGRTRLRKGSSCFVCFAEKTTNARGWIGGVAGL